MKWKEFMKYVEHKLEAISPSPAISLCGDDDCDSKRADELEGDPGTPPASPRPPTSPNQLMPPSAVSS